MCLLSMGMKFGKILLFYAGTTFILSKRFKGSEVKNLAFAPRSILVVVLLFSCVSPYEAKDATSPPNDTAIVWFPKIVTTILSAAQNVDFIPNLKAYQQTTDYTCGPAALLSLAKFYGLPDVEEDARTEMQIARELGTRDLNSSRPGTKPQEMVAWLEKNGFNVQLEFEDKGDSTALQRLRDNIRQGIPTLVEWIDLSGHWAIAIGYDYRNASDPWDDVLILADPYDPKLRPF